MAASWAKQQWGTTWWSVDSLHTHTTTPTPCYKHYPGGHLACQDVTLGLGLGQVNFGLGYRGLGGEGIW